MHVRAGEADVGEALGVELEQVEGGAAVAPEADEAGTAGDQHGGEAADHPGEAITRAETAKPSDEGAARGGTAEAKG